MSKTKKFRLVIDDAAIDAYIKKSKAQLAASGTRVDPETGRVYDTNMVQLGALGRMEAGKALSAMSPSAQRKFAAEYGLMSGNPATTKIFGLSISEERGDFLKFGYMDRTSRAVLSRIPGMSPVLYAAYRGRNIAVGMRRGLRNFAAYSEIDDMLADPTLDAAARQELVRNWISSSTAGTITTTAGILLLLISLGSYVGEIAKAQKRQEEELKAAIKSTTGMSYKQYEMWKKTQGEKFKSGLVL